MISLRLFLFLLKPLVGPGGKCVKYIVLGLTLKESNTNSKYSLRKFPLIRLLLLYFVLLLSEKMYFTAKIFNMHIISMGLTCM